MSDELEQSPAVHAISDWLVHQGLWRADVPTLLGGYCERLVAAGVPIWRGYLSALTLHPRVRGVGCSWRPAQGAQSEVYIYRPEPSEDYLVSPFARMFEQGLPSLRVALAGDEPIEFPLLARFRDEGATDYLAHIQSFGIDGEPDGETGMVASWTTDRRGGFSNRDLAILAHLLPRLGLAVQARLGHEIASNVLDAYVGPEAGRRILAGKIRRGQLEVISAVILYADLRGFTAAVEQRPRDEMVETLNCYFDCLVPSIEEFGGQVLKFMGDGLLATFPLNGRPAAEVCERALGAAAKTFERTRVLCDQRAASQRHGARPRHGPASRRRVLRQRRQRRSPRLHGDRAGGQRGQPDRDPVRAAPAQPADVGDLRQGGDAIRRPAGLDRPLRAARRRLRPIDLHPRRLVTRRAPAAGGLTREIETA